MGSSANSALWGSLVPGGDPAGGGGIDTEEVLDRLLPSLHAASRTDLTFWTVADLVFWMDEAVKRLARVAGVFVGRDATILTAIGQPKYTLPARHVATLHVSRSSSSLRPATQIEMEARDGAYQTTPGTPAWWYEDQLGDGTVGLAPVPVAIDPLPVIYEGYPAPLDPAGAQSHISGPPPLKEYLEFCVLAQAYGREGEMEMPDVARHARGRMAMYEAIFEHYYGAGL